MLSGVNKNADKAIEWFKGVSDSLVFLRLKFRRFPLKRRTVSSCLFIFLELNY